MSWRAGSSRASVWSVSAPGSPPAWGSTPEVFRAYFGIGDQDDEATAREKIAGRLLLLDESFREVTGWVRAVTATLADLSW